MFTALRDAYQLFSRLQVAITWQRPTLGIYPISSVPASSTTFANFKESLLCYKGKPLTVAFVARLMSTFFRVGENQQPARCANVMFKFMRDVDDYACRALLYEKAKPVVKGMSNIDSMRCRD